MSKQLRILQMIGSLEMGGSQSMIMNIYRHIDREKIQFDFIVDHIEHMDYAKEIEALGGNIYIMPTFKGVNIFEILHSWNSFFKTHPEYKILHSHVRSYASIYISIAKKYGIQSIIHSHNTSNGDGFKAIVKKLLQFPLKYQGDYLFACSEESGKWLFGEEKCRNNKITIIPNAINISEYKFNEDVRKKYRHTFDLDGKLVIGHIGRFHEQKNHIYLLKIFKELLRIKPNSVLVMVGDGPLKEIIQSKIKELDILHNVILLSNRSDVSSLLQMFDVFVFPSLWEGLPLTLIEAQASGIPCLVSESITNDIILTKSVKKISLENDVDKWVDNILCVQPYTRDSDITPELMMYDIHKTSKFIEDIYTHIWENVVKISR